MSGQHKTDLSSGTYIADEIDKLLSTKKVQYSNKVDAELFELTGVEGATRTHRNSMKALAELLRCLGQ